MQPILNLAEERSLLIVEDCALALGARVGGTHVGLLGDVGVFSFYPAKHITTAEGGMVCSKNPELIARISNIKSFGYDKNLNERSVPGVYDIKALGLNLRMSEMSAAMGHVQLTKLPGFLERRQKNVNNMRDEFSQEETLLLAPEAPVNCQHANYCAVVTVKKANLQTRNEFLLRLKDAGVGCSVYYPVPLPLSKYYAPNNHDNEKTYANASKFSYSSVALPVGPHISPEESTLLARAFIGVAEGQNLR
jgi:dTDP-4-amino-4,6-dideoxygalactose transaminase